MKDDSDTKCKIDLEFRNKINISNYSCLSVSRKEDSLYDSVYKMCLLVYGLYLIHILLMETCYTHTHTHTHIYMLD